MTDVIVAYNISFIKKFKIKRICVIALLSSGIIFNASPGNCLNLPIIPGPTIVKIEKNDDYFINTSDKSKISPVLTNNIHSFNSEREFLIFLHATDFNFEINYKQRLLKL